MTDLTKTRDAIRELPDKCRMLLNYSNGFQDNDSGERKWRTDAINFDGADLKALEARLTKLETAAEALAKELNKEPLATFALDDALIDLEAALKE